MPTILAGSSIGRSQMNGLSVASTRRLYRVQVPRCTAWRYGSAALGARGVQAAVPPPHGLPFIGAALQPFAGARLREAGEHEGVVAVENPCRRRRRPMQEGGELVQLV